MHNCPLQGDQISVAELRITVDGLTIHLRVVPPFIPHRIISKPLGIHWAVSAFSYSSASIPILNLQVYHIRSLIGCVHQVDLMSNLVEEATRSVVPVCKVVLISGGSPLHISHYSGQASEVVEESITESRLRPSLAKWRV